MTIKEGYTRISRVIGQWGDYASIDQEVLESKQEIGKVVHDAIASYLKGEQIPLGIKESLYFLSFKHWHDAGYKEFISVPRLYCDTLKITGEIDNLIRFKGNDALVLCDYKTSAQKNDFQWRLQGSFYRYLLEVNGTKTSDRIIFVKLDKLAKAPKIVEYMDDVHTRNVAMSALTTYRFRESCGIKLPH